MSEIVDPETGEIFEALPRLIWDELPAPALKAMLTHEYDKGSETFASVTDLNKPARLFTLERLHKAEIKAAEEKIKSGDVSLDEIEAYVKDGWARFLGTLTHEFLERADAGALTEKRFFMMRHGKLISGHWIVTGKRRRT